MQRHDPRQHLQKRPPPPGHVAGEGPLKAALVLTVAALAQAALDEDLDVARLAEQVAQRVQMLLEGAPPAEALRVHVVRHVVHDVAHARHRQGPQEQEGVGARGGPPAAAVAPGPNRELQVLAAVSCDVLLAEGCPQPLPQACARAVREPELCAEVGGPRHQRAGQLLKRCLAA